MARCIFHIDLDAFFVSAERALNPKLKGKPVIVGGDPERRGVVASASYEARPFGIHAGMPLSKARRLCPQAIFIRANLSRYRDASAKFMQILADFSPLIEPLGLDEAYLDATGYEKSYRSPRQMALAIKERIYRELKLTASVGIAPCKVVAKIASDGCKPDGLLEISPGEEQDFLNPLSVGKLPGVGRKTEQALKQMGISTIGELASLSLDVVKKNFGATGVVIHHYARGIDERRVEAPGESRSINRQITLAQDTLDRHFLEANLHQLCQEVSTRLGLGNKQAKSITLKLRYADFKTITRQVTLKEASNTDQAIFTAAMHLLSKVLEEQGKPVRLIGIKVSNLSNLDSGGRQLLMFDPGTKRLEHLSEAIREIQRKYGPGAIKRGRNIPI